MAAGSEQISTKWIKGAERVCERCGVKITNLAKQVGEVRTDFRGSRHGKTTIICMDCVAKRNADAVKATRKALGWDT